MYHQYCIFWLLRSAACSIGPMHTHTQTYRNFNTRCKNAVQCVHFWEEVQKTYACRAGLCNWSWCPCVYNIVFEICNWTSSQK